MGEKDMHESELNAAHPARHPRKKKRGRAGKVIRKTVKIVVVLVLAVGAGLFGLKAYIGKQAKENQRGNAPCDAGRDDRRDDLRRDRDGERRG